MICLPCQAGTHTLCNNVDTCPCQHRVTKHMNENGVIVSAPMSERNALLMNEEEGKKL